MGMTDGPSTLAELRLWLASAPKGTTVDAAVIGALLDRLDSAPEPVRPPLAVAEPAPPSWRERLWTAPAETRIGRAELLEAIGKTDSWLYRHTAEKRKPGTPRIPHRKLDGELVFIVGEIRAWVREHEEIVEAGPMESTPEERRGLLRAS